MVIVRNNQFFKVDLADKSGKQYSTDEFKRCAHFSPLLTSVGVCTDRLATTERLRAF